MTKKKLTIRELKKKFWALSRGKQEAFLDNLYKASPQNKNIFSVWLGENDTEKVQKELEEKIKKETVNRIGKFRKIRVSKVNEILRNAKKYPLPALQMIPLYNAAWQGVLSFFMAEDYYVERYEKSVVRYLEEYLYRLDDIADIETRKKKKNEVQKKLKETFAHGIYCPHIQKIYRSFFA